MKKKVLRGVLGALTIALPALAAAAPFTMSIAGVNPLAPPSGKLAALAPGMFVGLGVCNPLSGFGNSCNGTPPNPLVGLNPLATPQDVQTANLLNGTNFSNAAIFGYGYELDQVIFHQLTFQFNVTNGVVTPIGANNPAQGFDFVVGSTGGGSNGVGGGGFPHALDLARRVQIFDANTTYFDGLVSQAADLMIGDFEDTLFIYASDLVSANLGSAGTIRFQLKGLLNPVTAGDPDVPVAFNGVPLPSALSLLVAGLGLMGWVTGRGRRLPVVA